MLEKVMTDHMECQRKQMDQLGLEISSIKNNGARPKNQSLVPTIVLDDVETPNSKKRRLGEVEGSTSATFNFPEVSYASKVNGVNQLPDNSKNSQNGLEMIQSLLKKNQQPEKQQIPKSPRNICYGTAKGNGDSSKPTLSANVDLVASGVSKDCTNDNLSDFLKANGIDVVQVETLTKDEVLSQVRTKTFKVTVKPEQYEDALKPDIWPLRVAVRHFRQAKQSRDKNWKDQSRNTGGQIGVSNQNRNTNEQRKENDQRRRSENGANGHLPVGHPNQKSNQQQSTSIVIDPIKMNNFFEVLGKLGGQDISFKK